MTLDELADRLLESHVTLDDFVRTASDTLNFAAECTSFTATTKGWGDYELWTLGETQIRPINTQLFIRDADARAECLADVRLLLDALGDNRGSSKRIASDHKNTITQQSIGRLLYTLQQAYGIGCDVALSANTGRKHVGMKFESLIRAVFSELHIANMALAFRMEGDYSAEVDCVLGGGGTVRSDSSNIDPAEVIASIKTSSKDRMPKIFIDRLLMENVLNHPIKEIAVFHNDVQRKGATGVSGTFVANLFLVYSRHLRPLDGVYFCDPPQHIDDPAWSPFLRRIDDLFLADVWDLLGLSN